MFILHSQAQYVKLLCLLADSREVSINKLSHTMVICQGMSEQNLMICIHKLKIILLSKIDHTLGDKVNEVWEWTFT